MHRDRITAKLNPHKREMRAEHAQPWWNEAASDADADRDHGLSKAHLTYGARRREALKQIREIRVDGQ